MVIRISVSPLRHDSLVLPMSAYGYKRTYSGQLANVRFTPVSGHSDARKRLGLKKRTFDVCLYEPVAVKAAWIAGTSDGPLTRHNITLARVQRPAYRKQPNTEAKQQNSTTDRRFQKWDRPKNQGEIIASVPPRRSPTVLGGVGAEAHACVPSSMAPAPACPLSLPIALPVAAAHAPTLGCASLSRPCATDCLSSGAVIEARGAHKKVSTPARCDAAETGRILRFTRTIRPPRL